MIWWYEAGHHELFTEILHSQMTNNGCVGTVTYTGWMDGCTRVS